jgi:DNA polymerase/3'-5' exonuclease PolX
MKIKLKLSRAHSLAEKIKNALAPACERIEIAGSIRRRKPTVGDVEIVAIPKFMPDMEAQLSLFGDPPMMVSALDLLLDNLVRNKDNFCRGDKDGELYKNFLVQIDEDGSEVGLDLFLTTKEQWGYILALRTGPGDFNKVWVTQKSKGGLLPDDLYFEGGWLCDELGQQATPEECDVFDLIGGTIPATDRDQWRKYYR